MRRFFKEAMATAVAGGFTVTLDGKPVRTPGRSPLVVPTQALAQAIAAEWREQEGEIRPQALPLTRLANTAIDRVAAQRDAVIEEIARYGGTDLLCYRADQQIELAARQRRDWQPLLDWAAAEFGAPLRVTSGIRPVAQPEPSLTALRAAVAAHDAMRLAALHLATHACGSLVLGLALVAGRLDAARAFALSQLDESFQIEQWGEDAEQARRRAAIAADIAEAARFVLLLDEAAC
jgi:chaperone required for assembly of F1-ATPase